MTHLLTGLSFGLSLSIVSWMVGIIGGALLQKTPAFDTLSHLNFVPSRAVNRMISLAPFKWIVTNRPFRFLNQSIRDFVQKRRRTRGTERPRASM